MLKRLDRYILGQLIVTTVSIPLVLILVVAIARSLRYIRFIIEEGVGWGAFLQLATLTVPKSMAMVLPLSLFLTTVLTYQRLKVGSELVVLRAAGAGAWRLTRPALMGAVAIVGIIAALTLLLEPRAYGARKAISTTLSENISSVFLQAGTFTEIAPGLTVYLDRRTAGDGMEGILIHDERTQDTPSTITAQHGQFVRSDEGPRFVLWQGSRQQIDEVTNRLQMVYFDRYTLDLSILQSTPENELRYRERPLHQLLQPRAFGAEGRQARKWLAAAHERLAQPLLALSFTLIACAGLLKSGYSRTGSSLNLMVLGLGVGLIQAGVIALTNAVQSSTSFAYAIYALAIGPGLLAALMLSTPAALIRRRSGPAGAEQGREGRGGAPANAGSRGDARPAR